MAETKKVTNTEEKVIKAAKKETKIIEYKNFRDLTREELKKCDTVLIKLEKQGKNDNLFPVLTIEFHDMFKKVIRSPRVIDMRLFNLILLKRSDLEKDDSIHVLRVPIRYFERKVDDEVKYRRFELLFAKGLVLSDFFDYRDQDIIEALDLKFDYHSDKDNLKLYESSDINLDLFF